MNHNSNINGNGNGNGNGDGKRMRQILATTNKARRPKSTQPITGLAKPWPEHQTDDARTKIMNLSTD